MAFRPCHFLKVEYRSIVGLFKGSLEKSIIFGQTTTIPLIHTQQSSRFILRSEVLMSGFVRFLAEVRSDRFGGSLAFRPCHFLKVEYRSIVGLFKGSLEKSIILVKPLQFH